MISIEANINQSIHIFRDVLYLFTTNVKVR
jgi:hypothetical protein